MKKQNSIIIVFILLGIILSVLFIYNRLEKGIKMKIENIKSLEYFYTTGYYINADVRYNIECEKSCILKIKPQGKSNEEQEEYELSEETLKQIEDLLNKYQVSEWDGFNKTDSRVLDGNSFHFYVTYEDGKSISASGYMSYPKNYGIVTKELERILKEQVK